MMSGKLCAHCIFVRFSICGFGHRYARNERNVCNLLIWGLVGQEHSVEGSRMPTATVLDLHSATVSNTRDNPLIFSYIRTLLISCLAEHSDVIWNSLPLKSKVPTLCTVVVTFDALPTTSGHSLISTATPLEAVAGCLCTVTRLLEPTHTLQPHYDTTSLYISLPSSIG